MKTLRRITKLSAGALALVAFVTVLAGGAQEAQAGKVPVPASEYRWIPAYGTQTFTDVYAGYSRIDVASQSGALSLSVVTQDGRYYGQYTGLSPFAWWQTWTTGPATVTVYNPNPFPVYYRISTN